jgi:putative aldouronate transport system substrate-binding protein
MLLVDSNFKLRELVLLKKKALKNTAFSVLATTMAISVLAGCTSKEGQSTTTTETAKASTSTTATKAKDPVTIKVEVFDRGNSPAGTSVTNNYLTKYVKDNFTAKTKISVEYVPVPRSQEIEKLNVLLASGDAPDIVFTYDVNTVYKYVQQGGLMDLAKLIDANGPDLKTFLGKDTLAFGTFDNGQYAIPAKRVYLGKYSSMIRQDWLDKLGLQVPRTTDEVYNTLKAFKEKDPGATGGKTIPLGFSLTPASYEPIIYSFLKKVTAEQSYTLAQSLARDNMVLLPGHKEGVQFLNKLYNEGLISPDFALDKDWKKMQQDIMTGKVGLYSEDAARSYGTVPGIINVLQQTIPTAKIKPVDPYTNEEGKHTKPAYAPSGMYIMIPKASKHAAEAVQYLNWMAQKESMMQMVYGVEGRNYKTIDGVPYVEINDDTKNSFYNSGDMMIISNGFDFGDPDKTLKGMVTGFPEAQRADAAISRKNGLQDGMQPLRFDHPIAAEVKYAKSLADKYDEILVKSILAKPADFSKVYVDMLKDYMANGGDEVLKERTAAYKAMKK